MRFLCFSSFDYRGRRFRGSGPGRRGAADGALLVRALDRFRARAQELPWEASICQAELTSW